MKSINWKKVVMVVSGVVIALLVLFSIIVAYVWYSYEKSPEMQFYRNIQRNE